MRVHHLYVQLWYDEFMMDYECVGWHKVYTWIQYNGCTIPSESDSETSGNFWCKWHCLLHWSSVICVAVHAKNCSRYLNQCVIWCVVAAVANLWSCCLHTRTESCLPTLVHSVIGMMLGCVILFAVMTLILISCVQHSITAILLFISTSLTNSCSFIHSSSCIRLSISLASNCHLVCWSSFVLCTMYSLNALVCCVMHDWISVVIHVISLLMCVAQSLDFSFHNYYDITSSFIWCCHHIVTDSISIQFPLSVCVSTLHLHSKLASIQIQICV